MERKGKTRLPSPHLASALCPGDQIRVVAPASPFDRKRFDRAVDRLRKAGYRLTYRKDIFPSAGYLAGSDKRRGREFRDALIDRSSRAVFAARGGYGSHRLLDQRDLFPKKIPKKVLMGLSDLTVLLNTVAARTGLVTVHGPVIAGDLFRQMSKAEFRRRFRELERSEERILHARRDFSVVRSGTARGRLWGGNLTIVQATIGTPFELPFDGAFLFLEETKEARYRVDRAFAHLALCGVFRKIRALILGDFTDEHGRPHDRAWMTSILLRYVKRKIPILLGLRAGHVHSDVWLPIGGRCSIESNGSTLRLSPLVAPRGRV